MAEKSGIGYKFNIDIVPAGPADFVDLNPLSVSEALNEIIDTYTQLSDEGFSQNKVVAVDPQFDVTFKFDDANTAHTYLAGLQYSADRSGKAQIIDNVTGKTIDFACEYTAISSTRETAVAEYTVTVKLKGKPTIA